MLNRDNERDGWKINASASISRVASRFVASGRISACVRSVAAIAAALPIVATLSFTSPAHAQCQGPGWLPGEAIAGVNQQAVAGTAWDPDGPGPRGSVLVVSGEFTQAGAVTVEGLAVFDPATQQWSSLVSSLRNGAARGSVYAMTTLPNGHLIVAGWFDSIGGVSARGIARFDGTSWSAFGSGVAGVAGYVGAVLALPNGQLIAGGNFTQIGGVAANYIARWDGAAWQPLGTGVSGEVYELALAPNGDLFVGGLFSSAGGNAASNIARWDGAAWSALGAGVNSEVYGLVIAPDGRVFAGGYFTSAGGVPANRVAAWDGTSWSSLGASFSQQVNALAFGPNGELFAGGWFSGRVAKWNGSAWSIPGGGFSGSLGPWVNAFARMGSGDLVALGAFSTTAGGAGLPCIGRWTGAGWAPLGTGLSSAPLVQGVERDGSIFAAGGFADGTATGTNQASWSNGQWRLLDREPLGSPRATMLSPGQFIWQRQVSISSGNFEALLRVDGVWVQLGANFNDRASRIRRLPNGDLLAVGRVTSIGSTVVNGLAKWNGTAWSALFPGKTIVPSATNLTDAIVMPNGDLVIAGLFSAADGVAASNIARWNGTAWAPMGAGLNNTVSQLELDSEGALIARGSFTASGETPVLFVAKWNGSTWTNVGDGLPAAPISLITLPNGRLAAAVNLSPSGSDVFVWNGAAWNSLGTQTVSNVLDGLVSLPSGELAAWGRFTRIGGVNSAYFARYTFTGIPAVGRQPKAAAFGAGETVTLSATASPGYQNVSVRWKRNGAPIANGAEGASVGGGTVSGAADTLASPTDGTPSTLTITNIQPSDVGDYTATFTNACGSSETVVAKVRCRSDFDGSMFVDVDDYVLFIDHFVRGCTGAGQSNSGPDASCVTSADVDGSGFIDVDDFVAFVAAFELGC